VRLDPARLDHPPAEPPPVLAGVRRERSLALSGRVADGTVLSEIAGVEYVRWAREQIAATRPHRLVVYAFANVGEDGRAAREALRADVAERLLDGGPHVERAGIAEEVAALGPERLAAEMPDAWLDRLTVSGTPEQARATIAALGEAGADAVVLVPARSGADPHELARLLA
jgi:alkanesulfonate monooxygenase SsuD/methylene tetrahydromethanopterin reductase-like flavin-dependent oxidoreductase (luciferase family)